VPGFGKPLGETPPLAWGRLKSLNGWLVVRRNTPTGVGKTVVRDFERGDGEKHPHWRGEDAAWLFWYAASIETPPLAWGRLYSVACFFVRIGNTPTGVGKTFFHQAQAV